MEKQSKKLGIGKEGRYAMPFSGSSEVKKREKQKMPLAKRFAQAFLKLDTWFEPTKGRNAEKREEKAVSKETFAFVSLVKLSLKPFCFAKAFTVYGKTLRGRKGCD